MDGVKRLWALWLTVVLTASACAPPSTLRKMIGREPAAKPPSGAAAQDFPAPGIPSAPAQLFFGTVILTNEASWGAFLTRGQQSLGALVLEVLPGTPASKLGLQKGDVISGIDGVEVNNQEQLLVAFRDNGTNQHQLKIRKVDGATVDIDARLVPSTGFSLLGYLETKVASSPDPVTRYLLAEQLPDNDRAIEMIRGLLAEFPDFAEGHALLARRLLDKIEAAGAGGATAAEMVPSTQLQEMTGAINRAIQLDPGGASIYRASSQIYLSMGDGARAERDAQKALSIDDSSAEAQYLLGTSRLTLGRYPEALEMLYTAVQMNPFEPKYYVNLALCYRGLRRESDAQATFDAAKSLVSDPAVRQRLDEIAAAPGQAN